MAGREIKICIDALPDPEDNVFRIRAADQILRLLADAHETEFTIPDLVNATEASRSTVWRAVDLLDTIGAVQIRETPQRNYISINPTRLQKDDPILGIEQPEFHAPIRAFVERTQTAVTNAEDVDSLLGIVVFGSVARGEADRQSDIDVFVVIEGDRTSARRVITDVCADLQTERFDGDRFEFEPYVETMESARRAGSKLREILTEGITIYGGSEYQTLRKTVLDDE